MAENSRNQNRKPERKTKNMKTTSDDLNAGSKHQISGNRGISDLESGASIGRNVRTRGSGLSTKRGVSGSDYDGQNVVE
ncbi:hypothetical protein OCK74_00785 [Chitinophagaceae bacterium LB-8]|uniref:Uncharacterized protein n=1 Tax=Paraflavisolibacter caeni TaxID=2982496 RepID=A0A9X2XSU1_9BACT|nr:hypothetical protein [Paraflavisolibacter caeni]MCU7547621.1 hypothetical protein [Paraflavisolibacter caeni]